MLRFSAWGREGGDPVLICDHLNAKHPRREKLLNGRRGKGISKNVIQTHSKVKKLHRKPQRPTSKSNLGLAGIVKIRKSKSVKTPPFNSIIPKQRDDFDPRDSSPFSPGAESFKRETIDQVLLFSTDTGT